jgi:hypothetical protein
MRAPARIREAAREDPDSAEVHSGSRAGMSISCAVCGCIDSPACFDELTGAEKCGHAQSGRCTPVCGSGSDEDESLSQRQKEILRGIATTPFEDVDGWKRIIYRLRLSREERQRFGRDLLRLLPTKAIEQIPDARRMFRVTQP